MESTMLVLNGKKFARTDSEFTESLFQNDGTCVGYYKPNRKSITLLNMKKEKIGVINSHGCLCAATLLNGRYWYSLATIKEIGRYESYIRGVEECRAALREHCNHIARG